MMTRTRSAVLLAAAAVSAMIAAGCATTKSPTSAGAQPQAGQSAGQASVRLAAADVGNLGAVVTDSSGFTLYRFDLDKAKPPVSNCDGACAEKWPPALAGSGPIDLSGIDESLVGTVTRADGKHQLTLNGWPLYRFFQDTAPGEAKGQGVGGTWFAATPEGKKAAEQPATGGVGTTDGGSDGGSDGYRDGYSDGGYSY